MESRGHSPWLFQLNARWPTLAIIGIIIVIAIIVGVFAVIAVDLDERHLTCNNNNKDIEQNIEQRSLSPVPNLVK